jgi:hypothetical protein
MFQRLPLQTEPRRSWLFATTLSAALAVTAHTILAVPSWRAWVLGLTVVPVPPHVAGAVDVMVAVNNGIRSAAPFIAAIAVAYILLQGASALARPDGRTMIKLSRIEFSGVDQLNGHRSKNRVMKVGRRIFGGTALATLAILLVSATSGVETEVADGPLRPVDQLLSVAPAGRVSLVLQSPNITFMDESAIPRDAIERLVAAGSQAGIDVVPFGKHLFNLDGGSALEISLPDQAYAAASGSSDSSRPCSQRTAIVDTTTKAQVGDTITLNDAELTVARVRDQAAQMNRSIALVADSTVRECVLSSTSTAYFGAVIGGTTHEAGQLLAAAGLTRYAAVSEAAFKENNRDFWRANATPILLQLILYLALFSAFAAAGERQSTLQRNSREIGMLHAMGVSIRTLRAIERRRAFRVTMIATLVAAPLAIPVVAAFNASELGTRIGVGPTELSVGFVLVLTAMLTASRRSLTQFERTLDLPTAVKG